jgi:hypothetical protein
MIVLLPYKMPKARREDLSDRNLNLSTALERSKKTADDRFIITVLNSLIGNNCNQNYGKVQATNAKT